VKKFALKWSVGPLFGKATWRRTHLEHRCSG